MFDSGQNNELSTQAGMENVCARKVPGIIKSEFGSTVAHIFPYCHVSKKSAA